MKILIVEDDPVSKRLLQSRLEKWGHQVLTASNGFEALARLENESCPIVITDWMMPRMDGLELIRHLRSSETVGYVYIILLTAKQHKEDLVLAMEAGADDFVTKPFDKDELRVRLRAGERIIELEQKLADQNQQLTRNNKRMKRDLETAGRIQKSLLPIE